jgi:tyrosine aminotransferase
MVSDTPDAVLSDVRHGLLSLSQIILGATTLVQSAMPALLSPAEGSDDATSIAQHHRHYMEVLSSNAKACLAEAQKCPVLSMIEPRAAMYAMVKVDLSLLTDDISSDIVFANMLLNEENVFVLPGQCFGMEGFIRIVTCMPQEILVEAFQRINIFCVRHSRSGTP